MYALDKEEEEIHAASKKLSNASLCYEICGLLVC